MQAIILKAHGNWQPTANTSDVGTAAPRRHQSGMLVYAPLSSIPKQGKIIKHKINCEAYLEDTFSSLCHVSPTSSSEYFLGQSLWHTLVLEKAQSAIVYLQKNPHSSFSTSPTYRKIKFMTELPQNLFITKSAKQH